MECKVCCGVVGLLSTFDLIDTLWNVKGNKKIEIVGFAGFNRYIVECKAIYLRIVPCDFLDLIDTLWNVKQQRDFVEQRSSLI